MDWNFVDYMLGRFGLCDRWRVWIKLIKECISSTAFSVLVNGSPSRLFRTSRCLRQGDPLSPFLFTIAGEALGALIKKAKDLGLITGVEACKDLIHLYTLGRDCDPETNFETFSGSFVDISACLLGRILGRFQCGI